MAYLRDIPTYRCFTCGKPAKVEVVNRINASHGYYCRPCGERTRRELERRETADMTARKTTANGADS